MATESCTADDVTEIVNDCSASFLGPSRGISVFTKVALPIATRPWYRDNQRRRSRVNYVLYRSRSWRAGNVVGRVKIHVYIHICSMRALTPAERKISRKGKGGRTRWWWRPEKEEEEAPRGPSLVRRGPQRSGSRSIENACAIQWSSRLATYTTAY